MLIFTNWRWRLRSIWEFRKSFCLEEASFSVASLVLPKERVKKGYKKTLSQMTAAHT